jgi:hypothetical protein
LRLASALKSAVSGIGRPDFQRRSQFQAGFITLPHRARPAPSKGDGKGFLMKTAPTKSALDSLTPIERLRKISVKEAAALNGVSEDNFRRHDKHLIRKITPRRCVVALVDAVSLPPKPAP